MSDCYCDYERPTVYSQTSPVAKTLHRCSECSGNIRPGEKYTRVWGIWDGDQSTHKRCPDCQALLDYVKKYEGQGVARKYQWTETGELTTTLIWIYKVQ